LELLLDCQPLVFLMRRDVAKPSQFPESGSSLGGQDLSSSATKLILSRSLLVKAWNEDSFLDGQDLSCSASKLILSGTLLAKAQ
jgi:hypothetical protein